MFEADKSYQFLLGLNDDLYSQIRSQVLATKSLSSEKIFNTVTQEEQHKKLMVMCDDRTESIAAFTVNHSSITHAIGGKVMCRHCGRLGHEESVCYQIIGYPSSWVSRGRARGREALEAVKVLETKAEGETKKLHTRLGCWVVDKMCLCSGDKELSSN